MKLLALAVFAALSSALLSACGNGNTTAGVPGAPAANAIVPLTRTVVVTAVYGKAPIPKLLITLTRNSWPDGKLIAKGKTGPQGRVRLSGSWTNDEHVCAGGEGTYAGHHIGGHHCEWPFPQAITLNFKGQENKR